MEGDPWEPMKLVFAGEVLVPLLPSAGGTACVSLGLQSQVAIPPGMEPGMGHPPRRHPASCLQGDESQESKNDQTK